MGHSIYFDKLHYDPFIDFLKGISIVFVILTHAISHKFHEYSVFCLWGDMAVPIFLLIQVFHAYKNITRKFNHNYWLKVLKRVIFPFFVAQIIAMFIVLMKSDWSFSTLIQFGNIGPGSYFPYIYVQFAILLFVLQPLMRFLKSNKILLGIVFILFSASFEFLSCKFNLSQGLYRLSFFRYFFLIYLGALMVLKPIKMDTFSLVLSALSVSFIIAFNYFDGIVSFEPWFYLRGGWKVFHWISYFYVANLLIWLLNRVYNVCSKVIRHIIINTGKYSYEIFLFQLLYFIISPLRLIHLSGQSTTMHLVSNLVFPLLDVLLCVLPILIVKQKRLSL